jgi:RimJ/RimL family protein N-acetyltransferase
MMRISLICTHESFRPVDCSRVRWLDWENDYPLAAAYWPKEYPLMPADWQQNRADGFRYCAIIEQAAIAALAAVWAYSETHWEVAAVSTAPAARQKGYGTAVVCFATAYILDHGRKATILTDETNVAMRKTAERVGFYRSDERGPAKSETHQMQESPASTHR